MNKVSTNGILEPEMELDTSTVVDKDKTINRVSEDEPEIDQPEYTKLSN